MTLTGESNNNIALSLSRFLGRYGIEGSILVACSGGPDSVTLLTLLAGVRGSHRLSLGVAYFDHEMRPASETRRDIEFVARLAESFGLRLHVGRAGQQDTDRRTWRNASPEEAARNLRYAFLHNVRCEEGYDYIAVGHTADDQFETLVQRFFQGSDYGGLSGMRECDGIVIRPLLSCSREDVRQFLAASRAEYRSDMTNNDLSFLRNRIRHTVMPRIAEVFPGYRAALGTFVEKMRRTGEFVRREASDRLQWSSDGKGFTVNREDFEHADPTLRIESVYRLFDGMQVDMRPAERLPYRFLRPLLGTIGGEDRVLLSGHGFSLVAESDKIKFRPRVVFEGEKSYLIVVHGDERDDDCVVTQTDFVTIRRIRAKARGESPPMLAQRDLRFPFVVRSVRPGDSIALRNGRRAVTGLYESWGVPAGTRWKIPVVQDRRGVIAVMGAACGVRNCFSTHVSVSDSPQKAAYYTIETGSIEEGN